ncbi:MAG: cytochrome c [Pseudomonadota bacterium]
MRRFLLLVILLAALAGAGGWWISAPTPVAEARLAAIAAHEADPENGALVFHASGCTSCHVPVESEDTVLAGGQRLQSDFGEFVAPNISTDPDHGIGGWTIQDFANAMLAGVSPEGWHYYPAFPYASYTRMADADVADLYAYIMALPASDRENEPNALSFPFTIRRGIGLWKALYVNDDWVGAAPSETLERGRYLVEALSHCSECHTPRDRFGGLETTRWMGGAPNPSGRGRIPNITPAALDWSASDIAYYLETGFTPDYDSAGGSMAAVIRNLAQIPASDREAIAAYIKGLAPVDQDG